MSSSIEEYDDIEFIKQELHQIQKDKQINCCGLITAISITFASYGLMILSCQILIENKIGDVEWLKIAFNHMFLMQGLEYIAVAFSVLYYLICHTIESKRIEKYQLQINKLKSECKKCRAKIHEHYLKFNNAPVTYRYCNPNVLNLIIEQLEENENLTLRQAILIIDKKCYDEKF